METVGSRSRLWLALRTSSSLPLDQQARLRALLARRFRVSHFSYTGIDIIQLSHEGDGERLSSVPLAGGGR
jgi:hypothetical protein